MNELENIKRIANVNGYAEEEIEKMVEKHSRNIKKLSLTTLNKQAEATVRAPFKFIHHITNHLKPVMKQQKIDIVFSSNNKLKDALGNPKDKLEDHQKSGIYRILCVDCQKIYIGQSRRNILKRFKEHCSHIKFNRPTKSAVAEHALTENHFNITQANLKLLKQTRTIRQLDVIESIYIHKNKHRLMNNVYGPVSSSLFNFIKTYHTLLTNDEDVVVVEGAQ